MKLLHPQVAEDMKKGHPVDVRIWRRGVLSVPLFSEDYCQYLIQKAASIPEWEPVIDEWETKTTHDLGKEIGLSRIIRLEQLIPAFTRHLLPAIRASFRVEVTNMEEPFIIRYALDGAKRMDRHQDAHGLVSGVVPLNDGFEGCRLRFPDLDFDAGVVPVGHVILFPKTFVHEVTELISGERYSLAMWMNGKPIKDPMTSNDEGSVETIKLTVRPVRRPVRNAVTPP